MTEPSTGTPAAGAPTSGRATAFGLVLITLAYVLPGLVGHDPWKQDEAYSFGIVYNMVRTGDLVVPTLAADPFMEKPPAYYITAAGMVRLLGDWLPPHDAARLTTGIFLGLSFLFTGLTARAAWGSGYGAAGVLLLISTIGLVYQGHYMITDVALTAGMGMALYGLVRARDAAGWGGIWLGTGAGLAFMSKGLLGPGILGLSAALLPLLYRSWRTETYAKALLTATLVILPWLLIWPTALFLRSEELFVRWFWDNNFGRYLGTSDLGPPAQDLFWLRTIPWVTFPVLPLATWTLWQRGREALANNGVRSALVISVLGWAVLLASRTARDLYALPLLVPLAVIAAGAIARLPAQPVRAVYWISVAGFGLVAAMLWGLWLASLLLGHPPQLAIIGRHLPLDFQPAWRWGPFIAALALQAGWAWVMARFRPPSSRALLAWPVGLALAWGLLTTLHLPWLDAAKSYRMVFTDLQQALPKTFNCVADLKYMRLRESERGLVHYIAGLTTQHVDAPDETDCELVLAEVTLRNYGPDVDLGPGWERIWEGRRRADERDLFVLFRRAKLGE